MLQWLVIAATVKWMQTTPDFQNVIELTLRPALHPIVSIHLNGARNMRDTGVTVTTKMETNLWTPALFNEHHSDKETTA